MFPTPEPTSFLSRQSRPRGARQKVASGGLRGYTAPKLFEKPGASRDFALFRRQVRRDAVMAQTGADLNTGANGQALVGANGGVNASLIDYDPAKSGPQWSNDQLWTIIKLARSSSSTLNGELTSAWGKTDIKAGETKPGTGGNCGPVYNASGEVAATNITIDTRGLKYDPGNRGLAAAVGFLLGHELRHHEQFFMTNTVNKDALLKMYSVHQSTPLNVSVRRVAFALTYASPITENDASYYGAMVYNEVLGR